MLVLCKSLSGSEMISSGSSSRPSPHSRLFRPHALRTAARPKAPLSHQPARRHPGGTLSPWDLPLPVSQAINVFHPLTYEGNVDFDKLTDEVERRGVISQIDNFGQTPLQLFRKKHPKRERLGDKILFHPFQHHPELIQPRTPYIMIAKDRSSSTTTATTATGSPRRRGSVCTLCPLRISWQPPGTRCLVLDAQEAPPCHAPSVVGLRDCAPRAPWSTKRREMTSQYQGTWWDAVLDPRDVEICLSPSTAHEQMATHGSCSGDEHSADGGPRATSVRVLELQDCTQMGCGGCPPCDNNTLSGPGGGPGDPRSGDATHTPQSLSICQ